MWLDWKRAGLLLGTGLVLTGCGAYDWRIAVVVLGAMVLFDSVTSGP